MIFYRLNGRLGNNLFQYAAGISMAKKRRQRVYFLVAPAVRPAYQNSLAIKRLVPKINLVPPFFEKVCYRVSKKYIVEHLQEFSNLDTKNPYIDAGYWNSRALCYDGYFQSEFYFKNCLDKILEEVRTSPPMKKSNMSPPKTVGVHVRRGDYLEASQWQVCDLDYYLNAMNEFRNRVSGCRFLMFSDDPAWVRQNFRDSDTVIFDRGDEIEDFCHLAKTSHQIISNSSFSWWASRICENPDRVCVMPDIWINGKLRSVDPKLFDGATTINRFLDGAVELA